MYLKENKFERFAILRPSECALGDKTRNTGYAMAISITVP